MLNMLVGTLKADSNKGTLPQDSYVVPFWGSVLESPIANPKRSYIGAFG